MASLQRGGLDTLDPRRRRTDTFPCDGPGDVRGACRVTARLESRLPLPITAAMVRPSVRRRGFTLIELMVSLAIVVFLASLVTPMVVTAIKREKEQELRTALRQIRQAIDDYKQAGDEGRIARLPGQTGYPRSLEVLATGAPDLLDPAGRRLYFLRRVPRDPFFTDERVAAPDTWGRRSYASTPDKPEPGADVYDVYSLGEGTGINGVPYRQW